VTINGGTADFTSTFTEHVAFIGTTGELELGESQSYTGIISHFSKSGSTALDLDDIGFVSAGEATFSGTSTKGVLAVTDGTHTAKIHLSGDYLGVTFTASSDGHGGTTIVASLTDAPIVTHRFVSAMAGLAGSGGEVVALGAVARMQTVLFASPHTMTA
jgi:hypothetical protein